MSMSKHASVQLPRENLPVRPISSYSNLSCFAALGEKTIKAGLSSWPSLSQYCCYADLLTQKRNWTMQSTVAHTLWHLCLELATAKKTGRCFML